LSANPVGACRYAFTHRQSLYVRSPAPTYMSSSFKELEHSPQRGNARSLCIRLENAKGQARPWGPVFSTIIP
ncbi:hypothetical protein, partial [Treponema endosymbiont of Eucomonympha sp.]|uniref:hypothetical protein n=1 Tax=Treponema endosymbiont of Eucomonympha sp. TaxID=1580831 RepID=UPI001EE6AC62